jgi:sulfite reductase (ferredoxin)
MTVSKDHLKYLPEADQKDIEELDQRIEAFKNGKEDEERFKHYRLTRGVYGQRQLGVQMFRTKIPYGRLTARQLVCLADTSEKYTNGNLHLTTRQNIQMHYVKLEDSAQIWTDLAAAGVTAREACGNTVRNITASAQAGIDPEEAFDVSPYVQASFEYFLRNPICQEMGRKIKPAFSSSDQDSAFTYFHDFGFTPRLREIDGQIERGFKVVVGGGLGAVGVIAQPVYDFLPADQIIPFMEASIRVFDRYGEREKRQKARMKFLVKKLGIDAFMKLVEEERGSLLNQSVPIAPEQFTRPVELPTEVLKETDLPVDEAAFQQWKTTNTFAQKQEGYLGVWVRIPRGDIHAATARKFTALVKQYAADDIRITIQQGFLLRYVSEASLTALFNGLHELGLARPGANSIADVTACPGTDTCALGVTNSTGLAGEIEELIESEFAHLISRSDIRIKISGCMNSCGQHMAAQIGFHGSSIKVDARVLPAMQVVLGGGVAPDGDGYIAQKVIKLPTRRIPSALRILLLDYEQQAETGEAYNEYFQKQGKRYFYQLLKPLADTSNIVDSDFIDWGQENSYQQSIGVGECAGVSLDVVGTIIEDARQKQELALAAFQEEAYGDSVYHAYKVFVVGAKALLLAKDVKCNTHIKILSDFQEQYIDKEEFEWNHPSFKEWVLKMKKQVPTAEFAAQYLSESQSFFQNLLGVRAQQLRSANGIDKKVIENYYKA